MQKKSITRRTALALGAGAAATAAAGTALAATPDNLDIELLALEAEALALQHWIDNHPDESVAQDKALEAAGLLLFGLDKQIAKTPARGLEGVAVKLRRVLDPAIGIGVCDCDEQKTALRTALLTVERLAGGGAGTAVAMATGAVAIKPTTSALETLETELLRRIDATNQKGLCDDEVDARADYANIIEDDIASAPVECWADMMVKLRRLREFSEDSSVWNRNLWRTVMEAGGRLERSS